KLLALTFVCTLVPSCINNSKPFNSYSLAFVSFLVGMSLMICLLLGYSLLFTVVKPRSRGDAWLCSPSETHTCSAANSVPIYNEQSSIHKTQQLETQLQSHTFLCTCEAELIANRKSYLSSMLLIRIN
ncbi:hypothetical protein FGIG_11591, partial [Fasciola gigantica]